MIEKNIAENSDPLQNIEQEKEPNFKINEKGLSNSYLEGHLMGKGISKDLILECFNDGIEVTEELKNTKEGSKYFKLDIPEGAGLPGRFVLPSLDGPLGSKIANWNCSCEYKFRHGVLSPVIPRNQIPAWLVDYASTLYVIVEKNELSNGKLQIPDGPTNQDKEGSWVVSTAHYGPPSRQKPRVPKDCSDGKNLKKYLESLDQFTREQSKIIYVDLEVDGNVGLEKNNPVDENKEMKNIIMEQKEQIDTMRKEMNSFMKRMTKKNK